MSTCHTNYIKTDNLFSFSAWHNPCQFDREFKKMKHTNTI